MINLHIKFLSEYSHWSEEERIKIALDAVQDWIGIPCKLLTVYTDRDIRMRVDWIYVIVETEMLPDGPIPFKTYPSEDCDDDIANMYQDHYWLPVERVYKKKIAEYLKASFVEVISASAGKPFVETGVKMPADEIWERYAETAGEAYQHAYEDLRKQIAHDKRKK